MDKNLINFIVKCIEAEASKVKDEAAHSGRYDDGGSSEMLSKLHYWVSGINNIIPTPFVKYRDLHIKFEKEKNDPEFQQYLRLKEKLTNKWYN